MRKDTGLTVAELMVVIAIIAIVSSIAIPNIIGWLPNYRLGNAASGILTALEYGRSRAVRENASVGISFNSATDSYTLWLDNGDPSGTPDDVIQNGTEETIRTGQVTQGNDMTGASFGGGVSQLRFNARGIPLVAGGGPGGGAVTLTNSRGDTRVVRVTNGGNCRIE